ncbi:MAG: protein translocase subunit SecDF [Bacteroidetes bacterium GWA2_30_7]|nr:MAG: protein translocase subunit SecDF [Bacteroidetes bacterium GWA2_30_7]
MQNKAIIRFFAIALALVCVYQLWFTVKTSLIEKDAKEYANGDVTKEKQYLDSLAGLPVYSFLGIRDYTYLECKERELNLGLDLKGGMNVVMEVSVVDIVKAMANNSKDSTFNSAIALAIKMQSNSQEDFVTLFGKAFKQIDPNARLAAVFNTAELKDRINYNSTNEEVLAIIEKEAESAISNSFNILRTRIDRFGVTQPNIQRSETSGRILVELPGVKEPERVRKLLQGTAKLEFWETFDNSEVYQYLLDVNNKIKDIESAESNLDKDTTSTDSLAISKDSTKNDILTKIENDSTKKDSSESTLLSKLESDTTKQDSLNKSPEEFKKNYPFFSVLTPWTTRDGKLMDGPVVGVAQVKDTSAVNKYLALPQVKSIIPKNLRFLWTIKAYDDAENFYQLVAIKVTSRDGKAPLDGDAIVNARPEFGQSKASAEVSMSMNGDGAKVWARMTKENVNKSIAIVLDDYVYSFPNVINEIKGGNSSITGNFTITEAQDLANVLKSGKLPAPARIIQEEVVGPSLGKESINAGMISFVIAFILVLVYMGMYYSTAGWVANVSLVANLFFLFGVLASLGAVLTLPGIAGIVLTMGMAVDANVIIYERIREELRAGKGLKLALADGYKNAYSAIIDGNVTTIITGIVLFVFGSGPIQGFATTLIIGILTSLFSAIFISRIIFEWMLGRNKDIKFDNKITRNFLTNTKINFIGIRKKLYVVSIVVIVIGIGSLIYKGLNYGVDFTGGRTYIVRFDKDVVVGDVRNTLASQFGDAPEVKTFGSANQVKITTKYLIDDNSEETDAKIETILYEALKGYYSTALTFDDFSVSNQETGILSSQKVGPTIADDIKIGSLIALIVALLAIFVYIAIRFRNWQWGLGGVISLFHDSLIVISLYSIFYGLLPFNLEVDQAFIAAILTIIGYSINDSVIIFDRIREYRTLHPKWELKESINGAINSTLGRTVNTSGTTIVVLLAIFIFGGDVIQGFTFALLVGIVVGTYSSVFNATPVAYDFIMMKNKKEIKK